MGSGANDGVNTSCPGVACVLASSTWSDPRIR